MALVNTSSTASASSGVLKSSFLDAWLAYASNSLRHQPYHVRSCCHPVGRDTRPQVIQRVQRRAD